MFPLDRGFAVCSCQVLLQVRRGGRCGHRWHQPGPCCSVWSPRSTPVPSAPRTGRCSETKTEKWAGSCPPLVSRKWSPSFAPEPPGTKGWLKTQDPAPTPVGGVWAGPRNGMSSIPLRPTPAHAQWSDLCPGSRAPCCGAGRPQALGVGRASPAHLAGSLCPPSSHPRALGSSATAATPPGTGSGRGEAEDGGSASTTTPTGSWSAPTRGGLEAL